MRGTRLGSSHEDEDDLLPIDRRRELERQFRGFVELNDRDGYLRWLSLQPGFSPASPRGLWRAVDAWKAARAEFLEAQRRQKERAVARQRKG
jgi:hypothetical protein